MAPTVITAGLEKPATAWVGVNRPVSIKATITPMAVRSMGIHSLISRTSVIISIMETITISMQASSYRQKPFPTACPFGRKKIRQR
jgi:hypothetical protein